MDIEKSLQYIDLHICRKISVDEMAAQMFLSPRHFRRLFKSHTGHSPAKYIEQKKMEHALKLLGRPQTSILDTALLLGYRNYETFSVRFKKYYHIAPGDLKNILVKIRIHTGSHKTSLDFSIQSSDGSKIQQELTYLKETLPTDVHSFEAYVANKVCERERPSNSNKKYQKYNLTKYEPGNRTKSI